ncbi:riboflavin synthase [Clostridiaceae bacterium]|nr:riboflavin synthase [Clostridiaceae bacterium]
MFTGIIEEIGSIRSVAAGTHSAVLSVRAERILEDIHTGDSIAVNGVCLTVSSFDRESFTADVMHETLNRSGLGALKKDSPVNLERAMRADGRFGGHIVSGHIDGTGTIIRVRTDDNAVWYTIRAASPVMRYIVEKGSVAIDGISLTVAGVDAESFSVSVIPHTAKQTTLGLRRPGDAVNLENDCVGKYVEKLLGLSGQTGTAAGKRTGGLTRAFLAENGF